MMNSCIFNRGFCKYCNPACLLALALASFAAPSVAVTVAPDFSCISHNGAAGCVNAEQRLHPIPEQSGADTATPGNVGNMTSAGDRLDTDKGRGPKSLLAHFWSSFDFAFVRSASAGDLPRGVQAQASTGDFSGSFINLPSAMVPLPATVWLFASGLIGFVGIARRRREQPAPPSATATYASDSSAQNL